MPRAARERGRGLRVRRAPGARGGSWRGGAAQQRRRRRQGERGGAGGGRALADESGPSQGPAAGQVRWLAGGGGACARRPRRGVTWWGRGPPARRVSWAGAASLGWGLGARRFEVRDGSAPRDDRSGYRVQLTESSWRPWVQPAIYEQRRKHAGTRRNPHAACPVSERTHTLPRSTKPI